MFLSLVPSPSFWDSSQIAVFVSWFSQAQLIKSASFLSTHWSTLIASTMLSFLWFVVCLVTYACFGTSSHVLDLTLLFALSFLGLFFYWIMFLLQWSNFVLFLGLAINFCWTLNIILVCWVSQFCCPSLKGVKVQGVWFFQSLFVSFIGKGI